MFENVTIPLYVQVADLMRMRIKRGLWREGDMLPSIDQLMAEFGVARVTVRQATQLLASEGLVSPQRGRGTLVLPSGGRDRRLAVQTSLDDLVEMYKGDTPDLSNVVETSEIPQLLDDDGEAAPDYFHMRRTHARDGEPYCVVSIFIDMRVYSLAPERFRSEVVIPLMGSLPSVEIARARQTLSIGAADVEVANELKISVNSPVGEIRRVFANPEGVVIYLGEAVYRGDYIHLDMDLQT